MRSDDYMMTAEELRLRARKRRIWFSLLLLLLLLFALGFFGGKPAVHAIKAFQARRHAHKAFALIDQEKWSQARDEATAAYQLYPTEPEAMRAIARFLTRVRNQQALEFWKQLRDAVSLTRQDLRDEATIALVSDETELATTAIDQLIANEGKNATPTDWLLAAQLALQKNSAPGAQHALNKIFDNHATNERETLQAAVIELQLANLSDPESRERQQRNAWSRMTKLADGKTDVALDALILLAQRALSNQKSEGEIPKSEVGSRKSDSELALAIENHPLAKTPQKLVALDLQMHTDPSQKAACIERAITQWKDSDVSSLVALATWLNGHGEFQRALDTIPLERSLQDRNLFLSRLDALGALERWSEIKQLLNSERFPLDPVIQQMYLARCTAQLGEKTAAENNWQRALEAAGSDLEKFLQLGNYAEKNGMLDIAERAYDSAVTQMPKLRGAQQGRLRIAQAKRDTRKIHAVLAEMLKLRPNDTAIQNDEAYTRLLLMDRKSEVGNQKSDGAAAPTSDLGPLTSDQELIAIEKLAEELVRREPASLPHRTLLALARLKQHRPVAALDVYANINVAQNALSPSALAVHAAVLAANDRHDDARNEIQQVRLDQLLPEEQAATADLRD